MNFTESVSRIVLTCSSGVAPFLEREVADLGFPVRGGNETSVRTEGSLQDAMRLNLHLRTAHRVFWQVAGFRAATPDDLYEEALDIPWEDYIDPDGRFTVDAAVDTPTIRNDFFARVRVKDAVADRMRRLFGRRPDSGSEDDIGVCLFLHWVGRSADLFLNTSGPALSRRGYRIAQVPAPMRETLAAALVMATGWDGSTHLLNPMCGGGTIAIEAAWLATCRAPGLAREHFAFMDIPGYDPTLWRTLVQDAVRAVRPLPEGVRIVASDIDAAALRAAQENAIAAGVWDALQFDQCDVAMSPVPEEGNGVILVNPPYGTRLGDAAQLRPTYAALGSFLAANAGRFRGFVFTASPELADCLGLDAAQSLPFFNGRLDSRLIECVGNAPRPLRHAPDDGTDPDDIVGA